MANDLAASLLGLTGEIGALFASFNQLTGLVQSFVQAISPSAVQEFNQALRDVHATIGSALISTLNIFSETLRQVGGIILPVAQLLEPVFRTLAEVVSNELLGAVKLLAVGFELIAPILQMYADLQQEVSKFLLDLVSLIVAAVRTLKDILAGFFGTGDLKDLFKGFIDIIRQVVKALVTFAATLAVFSGFRDTVKDFAAALLKEAKDKEAAAGGLKAAGTNPQITDVASILRASQLAAFTAAGGGAVKEKTDVEWLKDIAASVKTIGDTKKSFKEALAEWWATEVIGGAGILGKVLRFFDSISAKISNFFTKWFP